MIYAIPYADGDTTITFVNDDEDVTLFFRQYEKDGKAGPTQTLTLKPAECRSILTTLKGEGFVIVEASHAVPITCSIATSTMSGDFYCGNMPIYVLAEGDFTLDTLLSNPFNQKWLMKRSRFVIPCIEGTDTDIVVTNFGEHDVYAHISEYSEDGDSLDVAVHVLRNQQIIHHWCRLKGYAVVVLKNQHEVIKAEPVQEVVTVIALTYDDGLVITEAN